MPDYDFGDVPWGNHIEEINTIQLSSGITSVGDNAFCNSIRLTQLELPEGLTRIGESAFLACLSLTSVTMPASLKEIGEGAFENCEHLEILTLSQRGLETIEPFAFTECVRLKSFEIPETVTEIGRWAFNGCLAITKLVIPPSVRTIGDNAFSTNMALTELTLSEGLEVIEEAAFNTCEKLREVTIPASVREIGGGPFADCKDLTEIKLAPGNQHYAVVDGILYTIDKKQIVQYPAGKSGTTFALPTSVTTVGQQAFSGALELSSLQLHEGVETIEELAFARCHKLQTMQIPAKTVTIGDSPCHDCLALTAIEVSPQNAHYSSLDGVLYDKALTTLIQYPAGKSDRSFRVPESVQTIAIYGFFDNFYIESVELPEGLRAIHDLAFAFDKSLIQITSRVSDPEQVELGLIVFFRGFDAEPCTLRVPKGSKARYEASEQWCDFAPNIEEYDPVSVAVVTPTESQPEVIYDLNGQRLTMPFEQLPEGVYIINGEKVIKQSDNL